MVGYLGRLPLFLGPGTYVTCFSSHRLNDPLFQVWTQLFKSKKEQIDSLALSDYNFEISCHNGYQNRPADALFQKTTIQPSSKIIHKTLVHPVVTRLLASSNAFRHFSPSSDHQGSFISTMAHCSCHRNSKTFASNMELRPSNRCAIIPWALARTSATTEFCQRPFRSCFHTPPTL